MTDARLIAIRQKLEMLGRLRGWEIPDPAPEDALAAYEAEHGVTLPAEYRAFLGQVANGGPGPDYGLNALGAVPMPTEGFVRVTSTITTKDGQQLSAGTGERPSFERPPAMDRPFAIEAEWCPVDRAGAPQAPPVSGDEHPYDGTLFLVDKGCGYFDFLVVTGPRAGQVWTDFTAGDGSIFPVDAGGFLDWYEAWLDEAVVGWLLASLNEDEARDRAIEEAPPYLPLVDRLTDARPEDPNAWLDRMRVHLAVGDRETVERLLPTAMALPRSLFVLEPIVRELHEAAFARADAQPRAGVDDDLREHPLAQVRVALAANPETDPALLLALVADDEHEVRSALARNPSADVETLDALFERARAEQAAGSLDATIHLELVAAHPGASASLIARAAALPVPADTPTHEITTVLRTAAMS
ncbi:MAG: SMI1/KNR4 family protein, partial [Myxococcales bacterium]|nr:SMI1/KNR4 family protein [Myxococcales bacterium]